MFPTTRLLEAVSQPFKRSQLGLFHGKTKQYGNNVPFSKHKTRRTWLPNVQRKRLFSDTLDKDVRVHVTTRALRTIKKHGGLDNYVAKTRFEKLGWEGMRIRLMIREHAVEKAAAAAKKEKEKAEGAKDDLAAETSTLVEKAKRKEEKRAALREIQRFRSPKRVLDLKDARAERMKVMSALGMDSLPTSRQTIKFLNKRRQELVRTLRH